MASEIKVDTISEKTSANGVAIDGLTIKDGGLGGHDITFADGAYDFDVASHDTSNGLKLGGTLVTATAAELNIMDGVTATAAEINLIDGGTARGTTAIADGDGVLINDAGTMRMTTVQTLKTYIGGSDPSSADGDSLGTASLEWSDLYLADGSIIYMGADQDVTIQHNHNGGLTMKNSYGDTEGFGLHLQTAETTVVATNPIGFITFRAPDEASGTDAVLDCAKIQAIAEGTFAADNNATSLQFMTGASEAAAEKMRIDSSGRVLIGTTSTNLVAGNTEGIAFRTNESGSASIGGAQFSRDGGMAVGINRLSDDGAMVVLYQAGSLEGTISVSGSTVAYGTFCGTHWSRLSDNSKPTILRGTVMESIATMMDWYQATSDVAESTDGEGNVTPAHQVKENVALPDGKSVGDSVTFTSGGEEYTGVYVKEDNEQLPMCKISNTADSKAVYGVFMAWDDTDDGNDGDVNDMYVASLGAFVVRVHSGETVAIGDYLQSKGDGTAKVQADDILRASTIAKVTSTTKTITHGDGSYCVPCTLHCG